MALHAHAIDWTQAKTQLPHPGTPQDRLNFIDSLRGWAAFYVVCYHLALLPNPDLAIPAWLAPIIIPVEIVSYLSRPLSLSIRLFANMVAGHVMLKVFATFVVMLVIDLLYPLIDPREKYGEA